MKGKAPEGRNLKTNRLRPSGAWFAGNTRFYKDYAPLGLVIHNSRYLLSMLTRIVRMTFQADRLADFQAIFDKSKTHIRAFPGCTHLELLHDPDAPNVRITYSHWDSPDALEAYRHSELFRNTWAATKLLFAEKPVAFSATRAEVVG
jgi:quinol monooxygenase YgiN